MATFDSKRKESIALSWFQFRVLRFRNTRRGITHPHTQLADDADVNQFLDMVDGLILAGCSQDLDPIRLGMDPHPSTRAMPRRREDFDRRLCKIAVERRIPILAIGSGMQTLNVICGGSIYQHVSEDLPKGMHHFDPVENNLRHIIDIVPGTRIDTIYGPGEIRINSHHHQAVDQLAGPFRVSATAPDGAIEAYETIGEDWYCVGVQWHPENDTASALDMQIFQHFLEACKNIEQPMLLPMHKAAA